MNDFSIYDLREIRLEKLIQLLPPEAAARLFLGMVEGGLDFRLVIELLTTLDKADGDYLTIFFETYEREKNAK